MASHSELEYIVPAGRAPDDGRSLHDLRILAAIFSADIARTAELTGLDLSDWVQYNYSEPMRELNAV